MKQWSQNSEKNTEKSTKYTEIQKFVQMSAYMVSHGS